MRVKLRAALTDANPAELARLTIALERLDKLERRLSADTPAADQIDDGKRDAMLAELTRRIRDLNHRLRPLRDAISTAPTTRDPAATAFRAAVAALDLEGDDATLPAEIDVTTGRPGHQVDATRPSILADVTPGSGPPGDQVDQVKPEIRRVTPAQPDRETIPLRLRTNLTTDEIARVHPTNRRAIDNPETPSAALGSYVDDTPAPGISSRPR